MDTASTLTASWTEHVFSGIRSVDAHAISP
jgi:hypothetical protein